MKSTRNHAAVSLIAGALAAAIPCSAHGAGGAPGAQPAADAAPGDGADADAEDADEDSALLELGLTLGSVYNWRGLNVYQEESQHDQNGQLAPSVTLNVPGTGLSINYWGSFQTNGANRGANVDAGVGSEQDLTLTYSIELSENQTLAPLVAVYTYPFATKEAAGLSFPVYVEPTLSWQYETAVDLGLAVSYVQGVQSEISDQKYTYFKGQVGRSFDLSESVSLDTAGSYGYKYFTDDTTDNVHDTEVDLGVTWERGDVSLSPAAHWAWTNLEALGFGDEQFAWVSIDVGYSL